MESPKRIPNIQLEVEPVNQAPASEERRVHTIDRFRFRHIIYKLTNRVLEMADDALTPRAPGFPPGAEQMFRDIGRANGVKLTGKTEPNQGPFVEKNV